MLDFEWKGASRGSWFTCGTHSHFQLHLSLIHDGFNLESSRGISTIFIILITSLFMLP